MISRRTILYDAETGERIASTQNPAITGEDRKQVRGWVLRYRASYARRTGHKIRVEVEEVAVEQDETSDAGQCEETHNPGTWPYIARCVQDAAPHTWHEDAKGRGWSA